MKVAIVGGGPRGLSVCERLVANNWGTEELSIHLFDPFPPGGRIWSKGAAPHFLMNVIAGWVTLFTDEQSEVTGKLVSGPSLFEWAKNEATDFLKEKMANESFLVEIKKLDYNDFPSRQLFGYYQQWFFEHLQEQLGANCQLRYHERFVVGFEEPDVLISNRGMQSFDKIVFATGHYPDFPSEAENLLADYADDYELFYQSPEDAAFVDTSQIEPGAVVLIKGVGLTLFDYIEHFATSRGGLFKETTEGLVYQKSGQEPVVYAGSNSGFPYFPRGKNQRQSGAVAKNVFLTQEKMATYIENKAAPDFFDLLRLEVELAYYQKLIEQENFPYDLREFTEVFISDSQRALVEFPLLKSKPWYWPVFENPEENYAATTRGLKLYLEDQIASAKLGNQTSPLATALEVLKDQSYLVQQLVMAGILTEKQYQEELVGFLGGIYGFLTSGPPLRRTRELLALIEAGVFQLLQPEMQVSCKNGHFISKDLNGRKVFARALIEARVPSFDFEATLNPLMQDLRDQQVIQQFAYQDSPKLVKKGLTVQAETLQVIDQKGAVRPNLYCVGLPLEGQDWLTTQIPVAGRGSHFLKQTDSIAKHILAN